MSEKLVGVDKLKLRDVFVSFVKIGAFSLGGGLAMIPMMEKELVQKHRWLTNEGFMDVISLSQAMPGAFAVNVASNVGYQLKGVKGSVVAIVGNILLPVAIILALAMSFHYIQGNTIVERIFKGLRPAVVALIAAPVFNMARTAHVTWRNCWIPIVSALLIWLCGVSPVVIILSAIFLGIIYEKIVKK